MDDWDIKIANMASDWSKETPYFATGVDGSKNYGLRPVDAKTNQKVAKHLVNELYGVDVYSFEEQPVERFNCLRLKDDLKRALWKTGIRRK